jgi:hypothetical protein
MRRRAGAGHPRPQDESAVLPHPAAPGGNRELAGSESWRCRDRASSASPVPAACRIPRGGSAMTEVTRGWVPCRGHIEDRTIKRGCGTRARESPQAPHPLTRIGLAPAMPRVRLATPAYAACGTRPGLRSGPRPLAVTEVTTRSAGTSGRGGARRGTISRGEAVRSRTHARQGSETKACRRRGGSVTRQDVRLRCRTIGPRLALAAPMGDARTSIPPARPACGKRIGMRRRSSRLSVTDITVERWRRGMKEGCGVGRPAPLTRSEAEEQPVATGRDRQSAVLLSSEVLGPRPEKVGARRCGTALDGGEPQCSRTPGRRLSAGGASSALGQVRRQPAERAASGAGWERLALASRCAPSPCSDTGGGLEGLGAGSPCQSAIPHPNLVSIETRRSPHVAGSEVRTGYSESFGTRP